MPVTVTTRLAKGSKLSQIEGDKNFTDLADAVNIARMETVTIATVSYTASEPRIILSDATAASISILLPPVASSVDIIYIIKKIDSTANTVTIDADSSETIDGATTKILLTQWETIRIVSDGAAWHII
jgi:hypothetical protein